MSPARLLGTRLAEAPFHLLLVALALDPLLYSALLSYVDVRLPEPTALSQRTTIRSVGTEKVLYGMLHSWLKQHCNR